jgi:hypothetical protein
VARKVFPAVRKLRKPQITSQVFIGSMLIHGMAYKRTSPASKTGNGSPTYTETFDPDLFLALMHAWANHPSHLFSTFDERTFEAAANGSVYIVLFSTIDIVHARALEKELRKWRPYLGAMEVDDSYSIHNLLYAHSLVPFGRCHTDTFSVFWDGICEDGKDPAALDLMREFGYRRVEFESLRGRYTIFDKHHTIEGTHQKMETQRLCEGLLTSVAERVFAILTDAAPALPEKLWAALKAFHNSSTPEEYAHVALSCRRIFEYVTDCVFPPILAPSSTSRRLDKTAYKNRLLAFADKQRQSNTAIDLVVASTATLAEQVDKLEAAVNKGVHSDLLDVEVRRCLIRTVMLLDDIISLRSAPFPMNPEISVEKFVK